MSIEKFQPSYDIYPERIERLKAVAPDAFADGKINWDILRESLGSFVESEDAETEHYAFTWPGKREARRMSGKPPQGTLVPVPGEGVNEALTENVFIEGDNLEVLKLLQKSYAGKIKMIYIDPPYNTGNDFIYNDNFSQPMDEYLKLTGQIDEQGKALVSNKKAHGRFHSNWLNMMYPRLSLAKNLLRDDGVIFISIERQEQANLTQLLNEVFGEENMLGSLIWRKKEGGGMADDYFATEHEYLLVYRKCADFIWKDEIQEANEADFNKEDGKGKYRLVKLAKWGNTARREDRPSMYFPIVDPDGKQNYPVAPDGSEGRWRMGKVKVEALVGKSMIEFQKKDTGWVAYEKVYFDPNKGKANKLRSILYDVGGTAVGTNELTDLFGKKDIFENPKPTTLLESFMKWNLQGDDIVLDFFAGSCPTAHAVFDLNVKDNQNRKFIVIQLPEKVGEKSEALKAGFKTIADIGKERIRRVIKKVKAGTTLDEIEGQDFGFKVFRLQKSHFNEWQDYKGSDVKELMDLFAKQEDALVAGWRPQDLILEVMLQEGFPLHSKIETMEAIMANKVVQVKSEFCQHIIFICLDEKVDKKTIEQLPLTDKDIFICLDKALTDEQKVALSDKGVIKTI